MKNERGFMSVALVALLPLLIALFALGAAYFIIKNDGEARHTCRVELLRAQIQIAADLRELMGLNPEAEVLRQERSLAEEELEASMAEGPGPMTAAAQVKLSLVIAKQEAFSIKQKLIISRAKMRSRLAPRRAVATVHAKLQVSHHAQAPEASADGFNSNVRLAAFDVTAEPPNSPTPDYNPSPHFRDRQEMKVRWSFDVTSYLPPWLQKITASSGVRAEAECSTTLEKEGNKWDPRITKGKL
jgi:hypothetical protein